MELRVYNADSKLDILLFGIVDNYRFGVRSGFMLCVLFPGHLFSS